MQLPYYSLHFDEKFTILACNSLSTHSNDPITTADVAYYRHRNKHCCDEVRSICTVSLWSCDAGHMMGCKRTHSSGSSHQVVVSLVSANNVMTMIVVLNDVGWGRYAAPFAPVATLLTINPLLLHPLRPHLRLPTFKKVCY